MIWTLTIKLVWIAREAQDCPDSAFLKWWVSNWMRFCGFSYGIRNWAQVITLVHPALFFAHRVIKPPIFWHIIEGKSYLPPLILTGMKGFLVTFSTQIGIQCLLLYFCKYTKSTNFSYLTDFPLNNIFSELLENLLWVND